MSTENILSTHPVPRYVAWLLSYPAYIWPRLKSMDRVEAQRAADAQRRHEYMASIEQAFANEKVEPMWASRASARVGSTFEGDEMLRNIAHTVECRQKTCRVQLDDDGVLHGHY